MKMVKLHSASEADSRIEVKNAVGEVVGSGSTDNMGNVSGYFYQVYLHGEELTFVVVDRAGNRSTEVKQNALIDDISPNRLKILCSTQTVKTLLRKQK